MKGLLTLYLKDFEQRYSQDIRFYLIINIA